MSTIIDNLVTDRTQADVERVKALAARDRSRAKKQAETLKRHEQQRAEETRLAMARNSATLPLCVVAANALTGDHNNGNVERAQLAAQEAEEAHNRRAHGMNSMPFGQCGICPEMYILLYSPLYLITKNGVPKDIKFGLMEEFG